jgi:DNA-binding transcriptional ArsR family regulator
MAHPIPVLAEATAAPELRVAAPSLAATMPTAMAMVDYAINGDANPTPSPQVAAQQLAPDLVEASHPVRAALAHGTALRSWLLQKLPAEHPSHTDWPALRRWLADLDDGAVTALLAYGIAAVLGYRKPPGTTPTAADVGASAETMRHHAVPVLAAWRVPDPEQRVDELLDPATTRQALLALLDEVWQLWLSRDWHDQLPALRAAADAAPAPPPGCGGAQWITLVTGLRPDAEYAEQAERAARIILMPCPGLGRSLSLFTVTGDDAWVLYSPAAAAGPPQRSPQAPPRPGISAQRLGRLAPALHGLGDRTRLSIVLHLLDHGPLSMPELADALQVHQSTISRQVAALRRAGLVDQDPQRRVAANRQALQRTANTLLEASE